MRVRSFPMAATATHISPQNKSLILDQFIRDVQVADETVLSAHFEADTLVVEVLPGSNALADGHFAGCEVRLVTRKTPARLV